MEYFSKIFRWGCMEFNYNTSIKTCVLPLITLKASTSVLVDYIFNKVKITLLFNYFKIQFL